jgi:polysaccharide chain length determinant protein (PEP-CTERM system associated)
MEPTGMTPAELLDVMRRRRMSLIIPAALVFLAGVAVAFLWPPIYKSTATILIEEQDVPTDFVMTTVTSFAEQRIQQINQRIMSFSRLLEIIQQHGLYPELRERRTTEEIVEQMREDTALQPVSAEVIDRRTGRPTSATIAFTMSYQGKNPQKVQQVANVLVSLFLGENLRERVKQVEETSEFLESELGKLNAELAASEARLSAFKQAHINELPELLIAHTQTLNNIERNLEVNNQQLRSLREREGYFQAQLSGLKPRSEKEEELATRKRLEELKVQLVAMTQRFSEEHPDVKKTRAEIAQLEEKVTVAGDRGAGAGPPDNPAYVTLAAQLASARSEIQSVQRQIERQSAEAAEIRRRIATTPKVEEEYGALVAGRNNTQKKVDDLSRKLMEARVAHGMEKEQKGERFTLIDPPRLPEKPFKPNRLAIVLIGLVLGIGAGVGLTALREFSDDAVRSADLLEAATGFAVLAGVPVIVTAEDGARNRRRRWAWAGAVVLSVALAVTCVHYLVMDLDVLWVRLVRRLAF